MRRFMILGLPGLGLFGLIAIAAILHRSPPSTSVLPKSDPAFHPGPVFHEKLEGSWYQNQDLGVSVTGPDGWTAALGDRSQDRSPYEGLVVRMSPNVPAERGSLWRKTVGVQHVEG